MQRVYVNKVAGYSEVAPKSRSKIFLGEYSKSTFLQSSLTFVLTIHLFPY